MILHNCVDVYKRQAYRQIREKIEDMRKRIELLKEIKESGQELENIQSDIVMAETMIRCIAVSYTHLDVYKRQ